MMSTEQRASQACDACRQRRIKCQTETLHDGDANQPCRRCKAASLPCTFNMPVKRRGPPAKRRRTSFQSTPESNMDRSEVSGIIPTSLPSGITLLLPKTERNHRRPPSVIDEFCTEPVFNAVMQNYITFTYPIIPVVHLPTFLSDLGQYRHRVDQDFGRFVLAICAVTIAIIPGRFPDLKRIDPNLPFTSRLHAVDQIQNLLNRTKPPDYYDQSTIGKWAIAYLLGRAYAYLGRRRRIYYYMSEAHALMGDLGLHQTSTYANLDHVDAQLRKKAFWLNALFYTHTRPEDPGWDSLRDRLLFEEYQACELFPLELDDEYITRSLLLEQPKTKPSLVVGFNALAMINNCIVSVIKDPAVSLFDTSEDRGNDRDYLGTCSCGKHIKPSPLAGLLRSRLATVERVVAELPPELGLQKPPGPCLDVSRSIQYESMRHNLHITHRWVQSLLIERLLSLPETKAEERDDLWVMLQEVCAKLLAFVEPMGQELLELHGVLLSYKIRQVAASLLDHSFQPGSTAFLQAQEQIKAFAEILSRLDIIHARY